MYSKQLNKWCKVKTRVTFFILEIIYFQKKCYMESLINIDYCGTHIMVIYDKERKINVQYLILKELIMKLPKYMYGTYCTKMWKNINLYRWNDVHWWIAITKSWGMR